MNCRTSQALLSAYIDRELSGHQMLAMRQHLASCRVCAHEFEMLREVKQFVGTISVPEPSEQLLGKLQASISSTSRVPESSRLRSRFMLASTIAAAIAGAVLLQRYTNSGHGTTATSEVARFDVNMDQAYAAEPTLEPAPIVVVGNERP